jgi:hypothetical protein
MGGTDSTRGILVGKPEAKDHLSDPDIDWKITLERIFRKQVWRVCTGFTWLRIGTIGGFL